MQILLASNNKKKLIELQNIIDGAGINGVTVVPLSHVASYPEPKEDGSSFAENALIKARAGVAHTGLISVADDSGLEVAALNAMPGILSARWSGAGHTDESNNALLLDQLADVPDERRQAAFVSVCALVTPDGAEHVVEGRWEGRILREESGENGFGYDPLFVPAEEDVAGTQRSSAQLSSEEKNEISHRGRALRQLIPIIQKLAQQEISAD
ncbi:RdgB/HAM1 family non-canonical purine NTP pyrophosphatase [Corynebacterium sp. sy039]|uniref:RdgB/HAM1 family non-canonical purine NTP pyrophosphatase n=1 Tax=Corynebacterium sp. sy039 TaxID=2599641 RepID=UPI0011B7B975|nr:RdgB/HAM1 family non-canonical purine NTP pyrophosphatase [Corynebacterium sp. sy039]QDZ43098.1 RdgB/HAM1 family non-canonical purine NTP pyrophosphatase [Corynebacterium sp. sy039]